MGADVPAGPSATSTPKGAAKRAAQAPAKADDRRRQTRGDARRQQILDVAVELFSANGYRGTGLSALADAVGMTHPGVLYYFGTKERLLLEVVTERERIEAELRADLDPATVPLDALVQIAVQNVDNAVLTRLYVVLAAESLDATDPLHDFFVQRYDTARHHITRLLRHGTTTGELRPDLDVDHLAQEILAVLMGLELQWLMDPDRVDLVEAVQAYVDALRHRVAA